MTPIITQFLQLDNFQRAWEKVAANRGCAGVDGETISQFASNQTLNIYHLRDAVLQGTYKAFPCKQVIIPKRNGKQRELKIPTLRDRIVQQALLNCLSPLLEETFSSASFAYRPNLSYINAVEAVAHWRDRGYYWVLDADIVQFFDHIDHQGLLKQVRRYIDQPGILCLIKSWISAGVLTEAGVILSAKGIPQGAVISPLLANIYLHPFDEWVMGTELKLVRYADDFLVLASSQARIIQAQVEVMQQLQSLGLSLNPEKTKITNFQEGFRFLGHGFFQDAIFPVDANTVNLQSALAKVKREMAEGIKGKRKGKKKVRSRTHQPGKIT